jgi:DNA-binding NtrC family response regulator
MVMKITDTSSVLAHHLRNHPWAVYPACERLNMLHPGTVLIVDSNNESLGVVIACAVQRGETPILCSSCEEARSLLAHHRFSAVFCNDELPDGKYVDVVRVAKPAPVVVLSRMGGWASYLDALDAGAFDYIGYPVHHAEVNRILSLALDEYKRTLHKRGAAA